MKIYGGFDCVLEQICSLDVNINILYINLRWDKKELQKRWAAPQPNGYFIAARHMNKQMLDKL